MRLRPFLPIVIAAVVFAGGPAWAETYPSRAIRIIVPFSPGGPSDVISRILAQRMQPILGQAIVVENRLGAGGTIGARSLLSAEPDGYTVLLGNTASLIIVAEINKQLGYDPATAFVPIANLATSSNVLIVHPALPVRSVQDLIAYGRSHPGELRYSSPGVGTPAHLIAEWFKSRSGLELVHIPYKGGGVSAQDVMSGQVQFTFENPATALPLVRSGSVRALAVTSEARSRELPDVPTMVESGIPDFVTVSFFGFVAKTGTRADIVAKLNAAVNASLDSEQVRTALANLSLDERAGSPEAFADFLVSERLKWRSIAATARIQVQ